MKKILFITYYFWPNGISAVRRITNFATNLQENGFESIILTAEPPKDQLNFHFGDNYNPNPDNDGNLKVIKIPTFENSFIFRLLKNNRILVGILKFLLLPDIQILWIFSAVKSGLKIVKENKIDAIYVSSQPNSTQFIGLIISKLTGLPWISEFRDPWTQFFLKIWPTRVHYWIDRCLERMVCKRADQIVVVTPLSKSDLIKRNPFVKHDRIHVIANGYSNSSFLDINETKMKDKFTISFVGRSYWPYYDKGGNVKFFRNFMKFSISKVDKISTTPYYFLKGFQRLLSKYPEVKGKIEVEFVGAVWKSMHEVIKLFSLENHVSIKGFMDHNLAIKKMQSADVLLYILGESKTPLYTVAARLYEYMATGILILALVPEGDSKEFLEESGLAMFANPTDPEEISQVVFDLFKKWEKEDLAITANEDFIKKFEYGNLTKKLSAVLNNSNWKNNN